MRKLLKSLLLILLIQQAFAANEDALLSFAKKNAGKFSTEIEQFSKPVKVRARPTDDWWTFSMYDQEKQILVANRGSVTYRERLSQRCTNVGSFVGQNSFGAKTRVQKQRCERLEIQDVRTLGVKLGNLDCSLANRLTLSKSEEDRRQECREMNFRRFEIPMTPQQYRVLKERGPIYEIDFDVGADAKQEVVTDDTVVSEATISEPIEQTIRILRVYGKFRSVRIMSPDGQIVLATYEID